MIKFSEIPDKTFFRSCGCDCLYFKVNLKNHLGTLCNAIEYKRTFAPRLVAFFGDSQRYELLTPSEIENELFDHRGTKKVDHNPLVRSKNEILTIAEHNIVALADQNPLLTVQETTKNTQKPA